MPKPRLREAHADEKVHSRLGSRCPIEHRPDQPRNSGAGNESEFESEDCGTEAVAEHDPHHLFALCSKRDANADFGGALDDDVGEDSEEAPGCERRVW